MAYVMDAMIHLDVGPDSPGPVAELRGLTWASRQRLERRLDIRSRLADRPHYRAHLEQLWGIYAAFEEGPAPRLLDEALPDFDSRRKLPLLARDLRVLSRCVDSLEGLARCPTLPRCEDASSALGCLYVLEGTTLGGRALLPLVEGRLGLDPEFGAAFLANYGNRASRMSGRFAAALDAWLVTPERLERAATAAVDTCNGVGDWLQLRKALRQASRSRPRISHR
jgi:heme oxygenase (biliverdin-IX-beta and delta-forming)